MWHGVVPRSVFGGTAWLAACATAVVLFQADFAQGARVPTPEPAEQLTPPPEPDPPSPKGVEYEPSETVFT